MMNQLGIKESQLRPGVSGDPNAPNAANRFEEKVNKYKEQTNIDEAYIYGYGEINGVPCVIGVMDSYFNFSLV